MKTQVACFVLLGLIFAQTGHAGGWVTSGFRAAAPPMFAPIEGPFHLTCSFEVGSSKSRVRYMMTQEFTEKDARNGRIGFTTVAGSQPAFLGGQQISLWLMKNSENQQWVSLQITAVQRTKGQEVSSSSSKTIERHSGPVSAQANVVVKRGSQRESLSLEVTCSEE